MSRAYCLTCNEPVHETPSGTCPLGHPVAPEGFGPEPWVGFAGDTDTETEVDTVPMHHLDSAGRPREHAGVGHQVNGSSHVNESHNGSSNGASSNGHGAPLGPHVPFPRVDDHAAAASSGLASDDLTALLADALRESSSDAEPPTTPLDDAPAPVAWEPTEPPTPEPADRDLPEPTAPGPEADWSELVNLAAELHLDEDVATDDGPGAPPPATPEPEATWPVDDGSTNEPPPTPADPPPVDEAPDTELSGASIDDLLAELTSGAPEAVSPSTPPPPVAPEPTIPEPVAPAPPAAPPPPPPPPAPVDETALWDAPSTPEDVGSAPTPDPVPEDIWAEPAPAEEHSPAEEPAPAPRVDLYNFTARGTRVGNAGAGRPARKKRGRKR